MNQSSELGLGDSNWQQFLMLVFTRLLIKEEHAQKLLSCQNIVSCFSNKLDPHFRELAPKPRFKRNPVPFTASTHAQTHRSQHSTLLTKPFHAWGGRTGAACCTQEESQQSPEPCHTSGMNIQPCLSGHITSNTSNGTQNRCTARAVLHSQQKL